MKLILAGALLAVSSSAYAYSQEQERYCARDAFRFCSSEIPNVSRVTQCMIRYKAYLSPGCRVFFEEPAPQGPAPHATITR